MARQDVRDQLSQLGIPSAIVRQFPRLADDVKGLLIYGSRARGDALPGSDLDVLALVPKHRPTVVAGLVSVSFYTVEQLESGRGSLFGAHLRRDARIVVDDEGELRSLVESMGEVDTGRLIRRVLAMSELFTNGEFDLPRYLPGLVRQARYLLRSTLYAMAIREGQPCFSVREIAARRGDPALATLLASRPKSEPSVDDYSRCLTRLRAILGEFPQSRHGSLEATVVNLWETPGDVLSMAFMSLGVSGGGFDYAEVEKILL